MPFQFIYIHTFDKIILILSLASLTDEIVQIPSIHVLC